MSTASKAAPPKPWERAGAGASPSTSGGVTALTGSSSTPAASSSSSSNSSDGSAPALPARPADMTSSSTVRPTTSTALTNSAYGANSYGATGYGGGYGNTYGSTYGSAYSSPYSRFGGYGAGGFGGYGAGYGGFGAGGYGSPYGGLGMGGPMGGDMSLTRQMEAGTQATFQLLQSVVSAFGGFAQMLESTYMATHSSFFAMIGVAEQFNSLKIWLGEVLSVFTLLRFVKRILGYGGGQQQQDATAAAASNGLSSADFNNFSATGRTTPIGQSSAGGIPNGGTPGKPKVSKKPIVIFFLTVIGLPWLMNKLVKIITAKQQAEARRLGLPEGAIPPLMDHNGQPLPQHLQPPGVDLSFLNNNNAEQQQRLQQQQQEASIDPTKLTFVKAQYSHQSNDEFELSFNKNDIIAVLTPKEERIEPGWWRGRLRDGKIGWFPSTHVQEIPMNNSQQHKNLEQKVDDKKS